METLGIVLMVIGAFYLLGLLLNLPFFFNNAKSKVFIKMMGLNGFKILVFVFGIAFLVVGYILYS